MNETSYYILGFTIICSVTLLALGLCAYFWPNGKR